MGKGCQEKKIVTVPFIERNWNFYFKKKNYLQFRWNIVIHWSLVKRLVFLLLTSKEHGVVLENIQGREGKIGFLLNQ